MIIPLAILAGVGILLFGSSQKENNKTSDKPTNNEGMINQLHPLIRAKVRIFLQKSFESGFNLRITYALRSIEEQNELYAQGRTKPGKIITKAKGGLSYHNYGLAFDVVDRKKGYNIDWTKLRSIAKSVGLEWIPDKPDFVDKPHFQLTFGYKTNELLDFKRKGNFDAMLNKKAI